MNKSIGLRFALILVLFVLIATPVMATASNGSPAYPTDIYGTGAKGTNGVAACASPIAAQVAVEIMEKGGNAVDAAVGMIYAVGLLEPAACGIGGAGQMLVYLAEQDKYVVIEYMTMAPAAVKAGVTDTDTNANPPSPESIAIPGVVYGTLTALEKFGTMTPAEVLQPVIDIARNGFPVTSRWNSNLEGKLANLMAYDYSLNLYTDEGWEWEVGDIITNEDLADTYEFIAQNGIKGFYDSEFTDMMCDYIQSIGGIITREDFANYKCEIREPISTTYRGYKVYTVPGPSAGGTALLEALNVMENFDVASYGFDSPEATTLKAGAFILGYKDGDTYSCDPAFYNLPTAQIIDKDYAVKRAKLLTPGLRLKRPSAGAFKITLTENGKQVKAQGSKEQGGTSHMVCMDKYGNVVSTTNTNGINFGSSVAVPGTGFVFSAHLGNLNNNPSASTNVLMPGIRVKSSINPTIVAGADNKPVLAVGSPGNWCTCSATFETIINYIDFGMDVAEAVNAPRSWKDGKDLTTLYIEGRYSEDTINKLGSLGYDLLDSDVDFSSHVGCVAAAEVRDGVMYAIGDNRRNYGSAAY